MMTMSGMIDVADLPANLQVGSRAVQATAAAAPAPSGNPGVGTLEEQEHLLIIRALEAAGAINRKPRTILRIGRDARKLEQVGTR